MDRVLPARIDAVLFDLDGTLVDSASVTAAAIIESLASFGCSVTVEQIRANGGRPLKVWFTAQLALAPELAEIAYWRYVETITARAALSAPMPGATAILQSLQARGIPMALVTNRLIKIALPIVEAMGWTGLFAAVIGQETAARTKPAADPALHALQALRVPAQRAALVGDTEADMLCGAAAGIPVLIGLAGEQPADLLYRAGATHVFDSLDAAQAALLEICPSSQSEKFCAVLGGDGLNARLIRQSKRRGR